MYTNIVKNAGKVQGGKGEFDCSSLVALMLRAESFRTISTSEVPIMISMPPPSGPYCGYAI